MNNTCKNISLLIISAIFLISSTGVYLTIHYCQTDEISSLFFFTPLAGEPCDHHNITCGIENSDENSAKACEDHCENHCPVTEHADCCSDTVFYIAVEDDFVRTDGPESQIYTAILKPLPGFDLNRTSTGNRDLHRTIDPHPPSGLHGKELAFFNSQFLL